MNNIAKNESVIWRETQENPETTYTLYYLESLAYLFGQARLSSKTRSRVQFQSCQIQSRIVVEKLSCGYPNSADLFGSASALIINTEQFGNFPELLYIARTSPVCTAGGTHVCTKHTITKWASAFLFEITASASSHLAQVNFGVYVVIVHGNSKLEQQQQLQFQPGFNSVAAGVTDGGREQTDTRTILFIVCTSRDGYKSYVLLLQICLFITFAMSDSQLRPRTTAHSS